jgi:hypothetical protein
VTVSGNGSSNDNSWNRRLFGLMEYRVVLGVVAMTTDGLVVAHAGVAIEDAELLAAAASHGALAGDLPGGDIRMVHGRDLSLIVLLEAHTPDHIADAVIADQLALLEEALAA